MAAVNWTTTRGNLNAAITTADGPDLPLLTDVRDRLVSLGELYDGAWSINPGVDAAKTAALAAHAAALTAWATTYAAAHLDADHAARHAEDVQATAQAGTPTPYVATAGSETIALAPAKPIAVATAESPITTAEITLLAGVANALRIVAKDTGTTTGS